jgi:antitoxin CcdA
MRIIMRISGNMQLIFDPTARKKATNVSINSDLLARAREAGINLSAALERALAEQLRRRRSQEWLAENREAIEGYNADVEARGVFSDGLRSF